VKAKEEASFLKKKQKTLIQLGQRAMLAAECTNLIE